VTRKRSTIKRRGGEGPLPINVEVAAAGYLFAWWREAGMESRSFWEVIAHTHGDQILQKTREATPGCRPGFQYAIGLYPPIPLIDEPPPPQHKASENFIDIEGTRYWYCAETPWYTWLECQAVHLRNVGEVDGQEWRRYLAWKRSDFEPRYQLAGGNRNTIGLHHLCY
jgi:hypothetical protein